MRSPFTFGKLASGPYFIDREKERGKLAANIRSYVHTVLISPRRWGKSSLVRKVAEEVGREEDVSFCSIDLFNIRSEQGFQAQLVEQVLQVTASKWEERLRFAKQLFKQLVPKFSMGVDPDHDLKVSFDWKEVEKAPEEILNIAEEVATKKKIQLVVCIDEFQNISHFSDPTGFQKRLRSVWQHHQNVTYLLYGSKRHMMAELFESRSMPFYKFGDVIFLEKIDTRYWVEFIRENFRSTGRSITEDQAEKIPRLMSDHPYFVQQLAHTVWQNTAQECSEAIIDESLEELLIHQEILFEREVNALTNTQLNFLKAFCDGVEHFSASDTLQQYELGTSANIPRVKSALENKEILDLMGKEMEFVDPLFRIWLERRYWEKR